MYLSASNAYTKTVMDDYVRRYLDKWAWLLNVSEKHSIDPFLCEDLMEFLDVVIKLKKEGDPIKLALAYQTNQLCLEPSPITVQSFKIKEHATFGNLKDSVNGNPLCYKFDGAGKVKIERIPKNLLMENPFLTLRKVSSLFSTLTFCLDNTILEANDLGQLLRVNRGGFWMEPCHILFDKLTDEGFPVALLNSILDFCLLLSTNNKGTIIVLVKNNLSEYRSSLLPNQNFNKQKIRDLSTEQMVHYSLIDGAMIINTDGELIGIAQKLDAPFSKDCIEPGRGAKHNSTSMYSKAVDCIAFVVSHEGPITVYRKGRIYSRCFSEIFGY
jgi:hypothetical protein